MPTPAPITIYQCPKCKTIYKKNICNRFPSTRTTFFSDSVSGIPRIPNITRCENCGLILSFRDLKPFDYYFNRRESISKYENAEFTKILDIYNYIEALKFFPENEKSLRLEIWHGFNDRIRENKELSNNENAKKLFINENDKKIWKENCEMLINLLDFDNLNEKIMIAELHRNLGNFDKSMEIIHSFSEDLDILKKQFIEKILKKDRCVFVRELWE